MKKVFIIFLIVIGCLFSLIVIMVGNDKKYINSLKDKFDIEGIKYIKKYDNQYIVMDNEYLNLYNDKYEFIFKVEVKRLCKNKDNYGIIFKDNDFMYLEEKYIRDKLIYKYYNIYDCKLIDEIILGGL